MSQWISLLLQNISLLAFFLYSKMILFYLIWANIRPEGYVHLACDLRYMGVARHLRVCALVYTYYDIRETIVDEG